MKKLIFTISLITGLQASFALDSDSAAQSAFFGSSEIFTEHQDFPIFAVLPSEAGLTFTGDDLKGEVSLLSMSRAQKRADKFCENLDFLQAEHVAVADLENVDQAEGWLVEDSGDVVYSRQEKAISQLSWISLLAGSLAYKHPMVFTKITCLK